MNNIVNIDYFKKQLECNISYQSFIYNYYKDPSNKSLLLGLYAIKNGICVNPDLINDLINPSEAKIGKLKQFKLINNNLDTFKRIAVAKALAMQNLLVIEGPPGTGKTSVIIEIVKQLKKKNADTRILITSQSHIAVDKAIEDLIKDKMFENTIARIRQNGEDNKYSSYSEKKIFDDIVNNSNDKLKQILISFNDSTYERFGNKFLHYNISLILTKKSIVCLTCNSIPGCHFEQGDPFDYVIIDEVGKFSFAELMNVARIAKKLILIGDPQQLSAILPDSDREKNKNFMNDNDFDTEGFKFIKNNNYINDLFYSISKDCKTSLNIQYRMSNAIGKFISDTFYSSRVSNGKDKHIEDGINFILYNLPPQYNVKTDKDLNVENEYSKHTNEIEIKIIEKLLEKDFADTDKRQNLAIITPYRAQADLMIQKLEKEGIDKSRISTIDSYQGKEYDYIIFTCTKIRGSSEFVDDAKRINVAVSRARKKIYVIGSEHYVLKYTTNIKSILDFEAINYIHSETNMKYNYRCKKWFYKYKKTFYNDDKYDGEIEPQKK